MSVNVWFPIFLYSSNQESTVGNANIFWNGSASKHLSTPFMPWTLFNWLLSSGFTLPPPFPPHSKQGDQAYNYLTFVLYSQAHNYLYPLVPRHTQLSRQHLFCMVHFILACVGRSGLRNNYECTYGAFHMLGSFIPLKFIQAHCKLGRKAYWSAGNHKEEEGRTSGNNLWRISCSRFIGQNLQERTGSPFLQRMCKQCASAL